MSDALRTRSRSSSREAGAREADEDNDGDLSTPLLSHRRVSREKSSSGGLPGVHRYDQEGGAKVGFYSFQWGVENNVACVFRWNITLARAGRMWR